MGFQKVTNKELQCSSTSKVEVEDDSVAHLFKLCGSLP